MSTYPIAPPSYYQDTEAQRPLMGDERGPNARQYDKPSVSQSTIEIRMAFVRKVYSILAVQLLATAVLSGFMMYNTTVGTWTRSNPWALLTSFLLTMVMLLLLFWKSHSTPINFFLLGLFTLFESYTVGFAVTCYESRLVLQALIITFGVFVGLTLFTMQSKWDFSGMGPILYASLWILVLVGFVQLFFPFNKWFDLAIALVSVVVFCGYIIFDTFLILHHLSPEDYIMASVKLYLDFINLFLNILRILSAVNRD